MIGVADLEKILALSLTSAYVKGEKPLSLMIVSDRPESGKTEVVAKFDGLKGVALLSDATAFALWRDYGKKIGQGLLKHIIIPEFLAPISRNSATVGSLIATLQMMMEEGLKEIHTGFLKDAVVYQEPRVIGIIVCLPAPAYARNRLSWLMSGFLSRFVVLTYKYSAETVNKIFDSILNRSYMSESKIQLDFPTEPMAVDIPLDIAKRCQDLALRVTEVAVNSRKLYGFREVKNILRLVAANVVLENMRDGTDRDKAGQSDYDEIDRLSYLFNEEYNEIKG